MRQLAGLIVIAVMKKRGRIAPVPFIAAKIYGFLCAGGAGRDIGNLDVQGPGNPG